MQWRFFIPMALLMGGLLLVAALVRTKGCSPRSIEIPQMATAKEQFDLAAQSYHARARPLRGLERERAFLDAIAAYQAVLDRFPNERTLCATALFNIGQCYRRVGDIEMAEATYRRVAEAYPEQSWPSVMAMKSLADLLRDTARARAARAVYLQCAETFKENTDPTIKAIVEACRTQAELLGDARDDITTEPE